MSRPLTMLSWRKTVNRCEVNLDLRHRSIPRLATAGRESKSRNYEMGTACSSANAVPLNAKTSALRPEDVL
jgi:hypothetical protein